MKTEKHIPIPHSLSKGTPLPFSQIEAVHKKHFSFFQPIESRSISPISHQQNQKVKTETTNLESNEIDCNKW